MSSINEGAVVHHKTGPNAGMWQGVVTNEYGTVATTICYPDQKEASKAAERLFSKLGCADDAPILEEAPAEEKPVKAGVTTSATVTKEVTTDDDGKA